MKAVIRTTNPQEILELACFISDGDSVIEEVFEAVSLENNLPQAASLIKKLLLTKKPDKGFRLLNQTGLLKILIPELDRCQNVRQNPKYHPDTVFEHCIKVCASVQAEPALRWAGLLHDIGKFNTFNVKSNGDITFYKHEIYSASLAKDILKRFDVEQDLSEEIIMLVANHMYHYTGPAWALISDGQIIPRTIRGSNDECERLKALMSFDSTVLVQQIEAGWTDKTLGKFITKIGIGKNTSANGLSNIKLFRLRHADRVSRGLDPMTNKQRSFEQRILSFYKD